MQCAAAERHTRTHTHTHAHKRTCVVACSEGDARPRVPWLRWRGMQQPAVVPGHVADRHGPWRSTARVKSGAGGVQRRSGNAGR
jgi:hypothetical protein